MKSQRKCIACRLPLRSKDTTQRCEPCRVKFNTCQLERYGHANKVGRVLAWPISDVCLEDPVACPSPTMTPFDAFSRAEINHVIAHAFAALSTKQRTIVGLHFFGDMRLSDVADLYGVSRQYVSKVEATAMQKIREKLAALGIDAATMLLTTDN